MDASTEFHDRHFSIVDYFLKSVQAGYLNIMTPHAIVLESEAQVQTSPSAAPVRMIDENRFLEKWLTLISHDPVYNRNFSLREGGFCVEGTPGLSIGRKPWLDVPRVLAFPADNWGCGHYRVIQPFNAMYECRSITGAVVSSPLHAVELERHDPEVIILQRHVVDFQLESLKKINKFVSAFKVYELDDYILNLPMRSIHRNDIPKEIRKRLRSGLTYVDRFVVSTEALADAFRGFHPDIRVEKLRLPTSWWGNLQLTANEGKKPRVGWCGGSAHAGDLALIADVVRDLTDEVDWVFFGSIPDGCAKYIKEVHQGVPIEQYPEKLASLRLDLAIAPLEDNLFNRCKSNLKFLEYGICGFPVIASDIQCYQNTGLPVTLVKNRHKDWLEAIRQHIVDRDHCRKKGLELRNAVTSRWMLEGENLTGWQRTWTTN
jgi:hypothetical protein